MNTKVTALVICALFAGAFMGIGMLFYHSPLPGVLPPYDTLPVTNPPTTNPPITNTQPTGQVSKASFTLNAMGTSTAVSSMTCTSWYDANSDGIMQADELRLCSDSSGTYTTGIELPIGPYFWVEAYGSGYQTAYLKLHMTGERNSDGTAKTVVENAFIIHTDDSVTYDGTIGGVTWDDSTDYNYTLSGTTGQAVVRTVLSSAGYGLSSRIWDNYGSSPSAYKQVYSGIFAASNLKTANYIYDYWIKWDAVIYGNGLITSSDVQAPDFLGVYMTTGDKADLAPDLTAWDFSGADSSATNFYMAAFVNPSWGDLMYLSGATSAPKPAFGFNVGPITGAGTTIATYGVAIHTGLTYSQMIGFQWTASAAYYLGTPGNDWDWVA